MKRLIRGAVACAAIIPGLVLAEGSTWLIKDDPGTLYVSTSVHSDCPLSEKKMDDLVKGVVIRSRIKPAEGWISHETTLKAVLDCMKIKGNNPSFTSTVRFETVQVNDDGRLLYTHTSDDYGKLGMGDKFFITQSLKDSVETAITEYLEVNFGLGED